METDRVWTLFGFLAACLIALPVAAQTIVHTPAFNAIELEGGGHVTLRHGSVQQVRLLKGSTRFTHFIVESSQPQKLRIEACNNDCPHNYDLEVEITTPGIDTLAVSGGGRIESGGDFSARNELTLAVEGGGTIDVRAMHSEGATAAVDGGGRILVNARRELTAAINGGGKIRYWGDPKLTEAVEGGGSVERGN
jgi:Putative auto-transporter adhesin, head GIN domain